MTGLLLAAILAPLAASIASLITGWRRTTATLTALSATTVLACAVAMGFWMGSGAQFGLGGLLRADALTVVMLVVIGIVGTLATAASIGYIDTELAHGHIDGRSARLYGVLTPAFLCAMVLAVCANNIGVIWVAIEATTVITAFLVGHRRTRTALEATWKYVVICSVGIAVAFLGTVLLYFAARDSGAAAAGALNLDILAEHAAGLDPGVARLAGTECCETVARSANVPSMHMAPKSVPWEWNRKLPSGMQPSRMVAPMSHRFCRPVQQ